jgi:hypothetical protein
MRYLTMLKNTVTLDQLSQMTPAEQYAVVLALGMEDMMQEEAAK